MKSPIFLFSMPRAGSTLLQRILLSHRSIGGTNEPWILLPLIYNIKDKGVISEYSSKLSHIALKNIINKIPEGDDFYYSQIRSFTSNIYSKLLKEQEIYFLDKTPRYYQIIDDIYKVYPNAKFIFLFRNPIHIYGSILKTWCNNNFMNLYGSHNDLKYGFNKLSEAYLRHKHKTNTFKVNYEELVSNSTKTIKSIQEFLEINYDQDLKHNFIKAGINTKGEELLGDPTGINQYSYISSETLNKWKNVFNTRTRKRILKNYITKTIIEKDLNCQGYSKEKILAEINELNTKGKFNFFKDCISYAAYKIIIKFNLYIYFAKDMSWTKKRFLS